MLLVLWALLEFERTPFQIIQNSISKFQNTISHIIFWGFKQITHRARGEIGESGKSNSWHSNTHDRIAGQVEILDQNTIGTLWKLQFDGTGGHVHIRFLGKTGDIVLEYHLLVAHFLSYTRHRHKDSLSLTLSLTVFVCLKWFVEHEVAQLVQTPS